MKLEDFIRDFAESHQVQHINDITNGIIISAICEDVYLVRQGDVIER